MKAKASAKAKPTVKAKAPAQKSSPNKTSTMKAKEKSAKAISKKPVLPKKPAPKEAAKPAPKAAAPAAKAASAKSANKPARTRMPRETRPAAATCRVIGCTLPATTIGYSRICYIKYWKQIKQKEQILEQGALQRYIRELVDKYPEKVILAIHADLATNTGYAEMIRDLDLYGGIDELEHAQAASPDDEEVMENDLDEIKKGMDKEDDLF